VAVAGDNVSRACGDALNCAHCDWVEAGVGDQLLRTVAATARPAEVDRPDFDPGPGPQWSAYLPDGMLADMLERESGEGSQWERLERIDSSGERYRHGRRICVLTQKPMWARS
jgi:hypothetical protein